MKKFFLLISSLVLALSLRADLRVSTLNCYFLFSPYNHEKTSLKREPLEDADYQVKLEHLAKLIAADEPDVVGLQEIGSELEGTDLAKRIELLWPAGGTWTVCFSQGKDTYTGQDVVTLVRKDGGARVVRSARSSDLDRLLSKHLVTLVEKGGKRYAVVNVHLLRPIGAGKEKHEEQLSALRKWVDDTGDNPVVLGDFNNDSKGLLTLYEAGELTGFAPTHLMGRDFDHIFSRERPKAAHVSLPPYGRKPNDHLKTVWSDHFLLFAELP